MIPRWFERLAILFLLLTAAVLRLHDLYRLPLGFSDDELTHIHIMDEIKTGTVRLFFEMRPDGGQESLYHIFNVLTTSLVGDGLLGYRMLSVWANLLALACLYRATRGILGKGIALTSVAIMVTGVWSVLLARSVTPLSLVPLLMAATLACLVWTFRLHEPIAPTLPRTTPYTLLGFLIGLGIYVHYVGVLLALVLLLFILYLWWTEQPVSRQVWSSSLFVLTLIIVLALPYMISVIRNPPITSWHLLWTQRPTGLNDFFEALLKTMGAIGWRGDVDPTHNAPGLPLMSPFWMILAGLGFYFAARRWREPAYALLLITLGVMSLPTLWVHGGANFTVMLLLQPLLFILAGIGTFYAAQYLQQSGMVGGWRGVALIAGLVFLWTGYQTYADFLRNWSTREDVRLAYHSNVGELMGYLDRSPDPRPALICVTSLEDRLLPSGALQWAEADMAEVMLHRETLNRRYAICRSSFVFIRGGEAMRVLVANPRNLNEAPAALQMWFQQLVPLAIEGVSPGAVSELTIRDELAELGGQLQLNSPLVYPQSSDLVALPVRFGRNVTLLGYLPPEARAYMPQDVLALTSYWRVDGTPPPRWGIFLRLHSHLQASPLTETNVLDVDPAYLQDRDVIIQTSFMTIPMGGIPGEYLLTLGTYDNNPLNQIEVFDVEATQPRGTFLVLGSPITLAP